MRLPRSLAAFLLVTIGATMAWPQAAPAKPRTYLHAGKLLDVRTGKSAADQTIVIEGDRIVSISAGAPPAGTAKTSIIELPAATALPGLFDMHTHVTGTPENFGYAELGISTAREALTGAVNAKTTLEAGFTSIRNLGAGSFTDIALHEMIEEGKLPGPRMMVSGPALGITGGHCDNNLLPFEYHNRADGVADGVAAVQQKTREIIKYGADVIKICATGGVLSKGDDPKASQYTQEELKAIVTDAHRLGRKVAAHAHGGEGIIWASNAGVDSIEHGSYIDEDGIAALKKNGTYLVPTLYLGTWFLENAERNKIPKFYLDKAKAVLPEARRNIAKAFAAGVKVAFGTDAAVYPHGLNAREFAVMVQLGMTPLQAIQSATLNGADLMGWAKDAGTLEPGKWADIIAVDGDPIADVKTLEHVRFVMKGGVVYKNEYAK